MCLPCEAAKERLMAAYRLRETVEGKYGLGPVMKAVFSPPIDDTELIALARELSPNNSGTA